MFNSTDLRANDVEEDCFESESVQDMYNAAQPNCCIKSVSVSSPSSKFKRRASLDAERLSAVHVEQYSRRSSIGALAIPKSCVRRSSLGEDVLRLNLFRRNFFSSINSVSDYSRRSSIESDCGLPYDPSRRSSLGAESLIEYDLEDDDESTNDGFADPPPEALLGLQYADDVFTIKRELEKRYHPLNCIATQPQVSISMRCTLVNWLVKVNKELKYGPETVFLAVNLLDRFLAISAVASDCCQLLAVCALFVAAKMEESQVPGISGLAALCSAPYQRHHFRRMEILLLTKLGFKLHAPSSWYFVNYLALKACQLGYLDRTVIRLARRIAETCLCFYDIGQYLPSIQAAASIICAVVAVKPEVAQLIPDVLGEQCDVMDHEDGSSEVNCPEYAKIIESLSNLGLPVTCCGSDDLLERDGNTQGNLQERVYNENRSRESSIMELLSVLQILFSQEERFEITVCSELITNQLAPFTELSLQENYQVPRNTQRPTFSYDANDDITSTLTTNIHVAETSQPFEYEADCPMDITSRGATSELSPYQKNSSPVVEDYTENGGNVDNYIPCRDCGISTTDVESISKHDNTEDHFATSIV